ncbi:glucose-6-phosphate isomerase [Candidatus Peregrinibacteria bacterium]|nr:MAG: glucose-6-phosphate isomerase [Candidatus Peregrinibacteria bacterium]
MKLKLDALIELGFHGLPWSKLKEEEAKIPVFLENFFRREQSFHQLPKVKSALLSSLKLAKKLEVRFKDIVVLGIGGSALGVTCLRDALLGSFWNFGAGPRLFVLDNLDTVGAVESLLNLDKTLFVVITKSGTTPETMAQYFYFKEKVSKDNFVFITDPEEGELRKMGRALGIPMLDIPKSVGGRFSVLSPVGLFPAALLGLDVEALLKGAEDMERNFEAHEMELNLPFQMAAVQYLLEWERGIPMTVMMPYSTRLHSLADWYRQLLAESIGKEGRGLTPVTALGVTDQHSQLQLYNEGPTDKLFCFLEVLHQDSPLIPEVDNTRMRYLSGLRFAELMATELKGTRQAVSEYKKPNLTIEIPEVNAYELGQLFMFFECSIAFLGEYYKINAFDQPGVELSKKLTRQLLT